MLVKCLREFPREKMGIQPRRESQEVARWFCVSHYWGCCDFDDGKRWEERPGSYPFKLKGWGADLWRRLRKLGGFGYGSFGSVKAGEFTVEEDRGGLKRGNQGGCIYLVLVGKLKAVGGLGNQQTRCLWDWAGRCSLVVLKGEESYSWAVVVDCRPGNKV